VPFVRPLSVPVQVDPLHADVVTVEVVALPPVSRLRVYPVTAMPVTSVTADHVSVALAFPTVAETFVGAAGRPGTIGITAEGTPRFVGGVPAVCAAVTVTSYVVPSVSPVTDALRALVIAEDTRVEVPVE
jgi:hypothetical protein